MGFLIDLYWRSLRNPRYGWVVLLGSLIYLISPLDVFPDLFPLAGQVDDLLVLTLMISGLLQGLGKILQPPQEPTKDREEKVTTIDVDATTL